MFKSNCKWNPRLYSSNRTVFSYPYKTEPRNPQLLSCELPASTKRGAKKKKERKKIRYIPYCLTLFTDLGSWGNKIQYVDFFSNSFKITYFYTISFNQYQHSSMIIANLDDKLFPKHIHFIVNKTIH